MKMRCLFPVFLTMLVRAIYAYQVGVGIYDMTGPAVEVNFMGYAVPAQRGTGIHQRLRARSFIFADDNKRVVYVSVDGGMGSDIVNMKVLDKINAKIGAGIYTIVSQCIVLCQYNTNVLFRTTFASLVLTLTPVPPVSCSTSCSRSPLWAMCRRLWTPGLTALPTLS